jgi:hypothetical protein
MTKNSSVKGASGKCFYIQGSFIVNNDARSLNDLDIIGRSLDHLKNKHLYLSQVSVT